MAEIDPCLTTHAQVKFDFPFWKNTPPNSDIYIYEYDDPLNGPVSCCVDGHSAMAVVEALENKWAGCGASGQAWWVKPFNGL